MNGKGDRDRTSNFKGFKEAFQKIDWSVKKQKEDEKVMAEDYIPGLSDPSCLSPSSSGITQNFSEKEIFKNVS